MVDDGGCQGPVACPMARADAEELRRTHRGPRRIEGGNSGEFSSESPEGEEGGQDVTLECQGPHP